MPAWLCGPGDRPVKAELEFRAGRYVHRASVIKPEEEMRSNCRAQGKAQIQAGWLLPERPGDPDPTGAKVGCGHGAGALREAVV